MPPYPLPLFPLNVVLFPGTPLPLHIFEPRYRQMLADCLVGDRRFGIVPSGARTEAPDRGTVGCVAEIRADEQLPDGRANLLVVGGARFVVQRMLEDPAPYLVGLVEEFLEEPGTLPDEATSTEVRALFARYYEVYRLLYDVEPEEPELPDEPVSLSFAISAALECDLSLKRRLLAARVTEERVGLLLRLIPTLTRTLESALRVHRRAHQNGKGSRHSVLPSES
jgi:ATP-dependent Lon protease